MRSKPEISCIKADRAQHFGHRLQHFAIDDQLFEIGNQPAFAPSGSMIDQIAMAGHRAPQRHLRLPDSLRISGVRCAAGTGPVGQIVETCQLSTSHVGAAVFGRAKGRRTGFHINIRGKAAIYHRRPRAHQLGQCNAEQRFGILLGQGGGKGHRRHRAHQREGGDHHRLPHFGHGNGSSGHLDIQLARRIDIDVGDR